MPDAFDIKFCRSLLNEAHALVKKHFPRQNVKISAWTYNLGHGRWEFHGPDKFYWYGRASNAYDARYKGWIAWLTHKGISLD